MGILTQERLKELLHYVVIKIDNTQHRAHRLSFLYMEGWIPEEVDHEDHNRSNNKWNNLRDGSNGKNDKNRSKSMLNTSGTIGVHWRKKDKRWQANVTINKKITSLGSFVNKQDAVNARKKAEIKYNFHPNHGK